MMKIKDTMRWLVVPFSMKLPTTHPYQSMVLDCMFRCNPYFATLWYETELTYCSYRQLS